MSNALTTTNFSFPGQKRVYHGKVRDVYNIGDEMLVMVASDRISAFDVVLPKGIPYKGQVLNQIASKFLDATADIVPNWKIASPDPNVTVGVLCEPYKVEMVIRGYLTGHAWREYKSGKRLLCGEKLPDGLKEHDKLPEPIITPTTKAAFGHDEDISRKQIIESGLVSESDYAKLEDYTRKLFQRGTEMTAEQGLILVDTKYEFGKANDEIILIDEIHTPDSSRYWKAESYDARFNKGEEPEYFDKEFLRIWFKDNCDPYKDEKLPEAPAELVAELSRRYIEIYETITGKPFLHDFSMTTSERVNKLFS